MSTTTTADLSALPGSTPDPNPKSTGYFVVWGFALLLLSIIAIHYLVFAAMRSSQLEKANGSAELRQLKAQQLKQLQSPAEGIPIDRAMQRVVIEYGRR